MRKLVFATNNLHKLKEVKELLGPSYHVLSLLDLGPVIEIEESMPTLEGNALLKAEFVHNNFQLDCFADDTGLEVAALNGEPGVHSARYAGPDCNSGENIKKLLSALGDSVDRQARFRTVIALILDQKKYYFEGVVEGNILEHPRGTGGFGYDSIFVPKGHQQSFAEISLSEKNMISHRAIAIGKLVQFLSGRQIC